MIIEMNGREVPAVLLGSNDAGERLMMTDDAFILATDFDAPATDGVMVTRVHDGQWLEQEEARRWCEAAHVPMAYPNGRRIHAWF